MTANAYNQAAKDLYFDNSEAKWEKCYVYIGKSDYTACYDMTRVNGTQYLWQLPANFNNGSSWNGASGWVVCKEKWWASSQETIDKYIWHGDNNVTKKSTSAWVDTHIYKTNGAANATSDGTTQKVYTVTSYTKSNYTVTISTVEGGTLTVKDYDDNAVATGASKIHLTVLKFSATPTDGYVLDAVEINDGTNTTTIAAADLATTTHTLTSAVTITPVWHATTSTVTVTATATNGTVTGGGVVEEGTSVTLTATPADGYKFVNWTVGGAEVSTANPYTFTAEEDVTVVANFEETPKATIYFVNNSGWSKIQAYAWEGTKGANPGWPGADITANKLGEQIGGFDVYSYTVEQGSYGKVIFNNGSAQTADYVWTDGNYYWHNEAANFAGGTKAQAEEKFSVPVEYDYVYLINTNDWAKAYIYTWTPEVAGWPGAEMTKEDYQIAGKDVYSYKEVKGSTFGGMLFNNGDGTQTGDLTWQAGKYYAPSTGEWYADAATAEAALAAVVTYDYYVVGTINGWGLKDASYGMELSGDVYEKEVAFVIGKHELKINNGAWDNANTFGYDNLSVAYEGVSRGSGDGDNNIVIDLAEAKTITIKLDKNTKKITLEGLTQIHTVKATVNPAETGTIEGAGTYAQGTEVTLTANPAEGYEFVNWTVAGEVVSTEATYSFAVTADVALVANFKKKVSIITETYTLSADAADTNRGGQWYVEVPGEEEAKYQIIIPGYEGPGTYEEVTWRVNMNGEWTAMSATVTVTYDEENNLDVYVISATTEDSSTIYNVTLNVDHKEAEEKPEAAIIPLESYMPKVTKITEDWGDETEPWLVTSYIWTNGAYDPIEFNLTVTLAAGLAPSLEGYIAETEVMGVEGEVLAGEEEGYAILRAKATDGTNIYTIELMAELTTEEEGGTRAITVIEAEIYPNSDNKTDLDIYGWSDTDEEVTVTLWEGTSKLYGEYTDDLNVYIGGWKQYSLVEETTATFNLVDGLAVFNATVANGNDTVVLTMSGAPWVHPKDIVPTDTVNHTILKGTIGLLYSMFLNIKGESDDIYVNISTENKTATSEDIENCSSAYVTIDDVQINLLRGQFEIVTVGDVKIAYIGALGADHKWYNIIVTTGSEAPTALDNLGTTVAPVKVIVNGQLIITKDGVQYNAQGQMVK